MESQKRKKLRELTLQSPDFQIWITNCIKIIDFYSHGSPQEIISIPIVVYVIC